jgi:hypothetical protein
VEGDQENKTGYHSSPPIRTTQGIWARSNVEKAHAFAKHLAQVFQPYPTENKLFFLLFISNQNYTRFYKLICCDSV